MSEKINYSSSDGEKEKMLNEEKSEKKVTSEKDKLLRENLEDLFKDTLITDETACGFWIFTGPIIQKFANKKAYVFLYGVVGCIFAATFAYFNGTITTIEKRFKIPSKNTGIISVGNDISQLFISAVLSYYAGKGHRPRWMAFGLFTIVLFCALTALPHFLYGAGEDALALTVEYGATLDNMATSDLIEKTKLKSLCRLDNSTTGHTECEVESGNLAPQVILFIAQLVAGIGGSLYYTLGVSYMDDNIKRSKTPALISLSYFLRLLGPAFGYSLASFSLKSFISPTLTPTITPMDPRWLGAWWLGWIILAIVLAFFAFLIGLFPKTLPRAAVRRQIRMERLKRGWSVEEARANEKPASLGDMMITFKKLLYNKTYMSNTIAGIFYFFGYMPFWMFTPKYIEIQYRQSASTSSLVTGTVALGFSAIGVLASGLVISKYKPRARYMAAWNVLVGALSVVGILTYIYLGCEANESTMVASALPSSESACSSSCHCDYVKYSPVCGNDGLTYISPCHAGCTAQTNFPNGTKTYELCSCIESSNSTSKPFLDLPLTILDPDYNETYSSVPPSSESLYEKFGSAISGACPVDCYRQFVWYLMVMCFNKFAGATGRASNFLVSVRCVEEKDKPVAMGFGLMLMSLFSFIPSPIFFGYIMDSTCLVWGKTCSGTGNCWLYDSRSLRYYINVIAAILVGIGTLFDFGVWYYVKDLKIFDEDITELNEIIKKDDEKANLEKK